MRAQLTAAVGIEDPHLNVDYSDPPSITEADVVAWRHQTDPIPGDTDLDGDVDVADPNNLAEFWEMDATQVGILRWVNGDFDYRGNVDVVDLNKLGANWQHGVHRNVVVIPEPKSWRLWLGAVLISAMPRGQQKRNKTRLGERRIHNRS